MKRRLRRRMGLETTDASRGAGPLTTGFVLLSLGGFFLAERFGLAEQLGLGAFSAEEAWPLILVVVGFSLLVSAPFRGGASKVLPGMINLFLGFFFLLFTLEFIDWGRLSALWPVFPLVVGVSFFGTFVASLGRKPGLLVPGLVCSTVGVVGLTFTVTPIGSFLAFLGWPLLLLSLGALFVLGGLVSLVARSLLSLAGT